MGRGVSSGGGQSSLGYLFGTDEPPKPAVNPTPTATPVPAVNNAEPVQKPSSASSPTNNNANVPAGIQGKTTNNYFRADGQNTGNFITDRPSTKVHSAPGGGSSLGYLFGDGSK